MFMSAFEKIGFPTALIILIILKMWEPLAVTMLAEVLLSTGVLVAISKGARIKAFFKALLVTPLRYALMAQEVVNVYPEAVGSIGDFMTVNYSMIPEA